MEIESLEKLGNQVMNLLDKYNSLKRDFGELEQLSAQLKAENSDLKRGNEQLKTEVDEARRNSRDFEKEERIRARVDELLTKLEGF